MNDQLRKAATIRKLIYLGLIIGLFTISMFWRGRIPLPFGEANKPVEERTFVDSVASLPIMAQADELEMRELDLGDPEIASSAARLSMIGFRGFVISYVWKTAYDKFKRHEFHEFEMLARLVTRLQPNFITPWLFQGWSISYNVSVENDKLGDMYFYIARGIELLTEGDRLNTKILRRGGKTHFVGSPDIRREIGFYYQNKFGVSDKVNTLRSLMQLSCIAPEQRSPQSLMIGDQVDPEKFRDFCIQNPQLVRRLRTKLDCRTPQRVVDFLAVNQTVPTRYKPSGELKADADQFPTLPPPFVSDLEEYTPRSETTDTFDAFHAARAWYEYGQTVVPPTGEKGEPSAAPKPGEYDQFLYRIPQRPALILYRMHPARAQHYLAERLAKEGWFDADTTWNPDALSDPSSYWFPLQGTGQAVELTSKIYTASEWDKSYQLWDKFGRRNGLLLNDAELLNYKNTAEKTYALAGPGQLPPDFTDEQLAVFGLTQADLKARRAWEYYQQNQRVSNFMYFLESSKAEKTKDAIEARKQFWAAQESRDNANNRTAIEQYTEAIASWRRVLLEFEAFHHGERSDSVQEQLYEYELALVELLREDAGVREQVSKTMVALAAVMPPLPPDTEKDVSMAVAENEALTRIALRASNNNLSEVSNTKANEMALGSYGSAVGGVISIAQDPLRSMARRDAINNEFSWMKHFTSENRDIPWVRDVFRESVRNRLGLIRTPAQPTEAPEMPSEEAIPTRE